MGFKEWRRGMWKSLEEEKRGKDWCNYIIISKKPSVIIRMYFMPLLNYQRMNKNIFEIEIKMNTTWENEIISLQLIHFACSYDSCKLEECIFSPDIRIIDGCEASFGFWELNLDPVKEQLAPLITEQLLLPSWYLLLMCSLSYSLCTKYFFSFCGHWGIYLHTLYIFKLQSVFEIEK